MLQMLLSLTYEQGSSKPRFNTETEDLILCKAGEACVPESYRKRSTGGVKLTAWSIASVIAMSEEALG